MSLRKDPKLIQIINEQTKALRKKSTRAEQILWDQLRNRKFFGYKFYRQYPIIFDIGGKETFFILDFYCHKKKLAIEVDGEIHRTRAQEDKKRDAILRQLGVKVIRFKNEEIEFKLDESLYILTQILIHLSKI